MRFFQAMMLFTLVSGLPAAEKPFTRLFVFGDSYSDLGEGYLDGNGPTAVGYMADDLGLKLLPSNRQHSANDSLDFAVSGAQTGLGMGRKIGDALLSYGMQNQVSDFKRLVEQKRIQFDPATSLFFIAGGLNDRNLPTEQTITNLKGEIVQLYKLGARHIELAELPTTIPDFSAVATRLNPALMLIPNQLKSELPKATITLSQWGPFFDEVMTHPSRYGIDNTTKACAGREIFHEDATPCRKPDGHYYYHAGHPSTAVHKIVGAKLAEEVRSIN